MALKVKVSESIPLTSSNGGIVLGQQLVDYIADFEIERVVCSSSYLCDCQVRQKINDNYLPDLLVFSFMYNPSEGDIFTQAETHLRGLPQFAGAEEVL